MPPERRTRPSYMRGVSEEVARVSGVCPPHGRRRRRHLEGETDAWGLHGGDFAVGLARMLLQSIPMG